MQDSDLQVAQSVEHNVAGFGHSAVSHLQVAQRFMFWSSTLMQAPDLLVAQLVEHSNKCCKCWVIIQVPDLLRAQQLEHNVICFDTNTSSRIPGSSDSRG